MKYRIVCKTCGREIGGFEEWFRMGQRCPCGSSMVEVEYPEVDYGRLSFGGGDSMYGYFDYLPLNHSGSVVSMGEGAVPIERWGYLEEFAAREGVRCQVWVVRNDLNGGTGTFKDISASLAASVLKECGVRRYCLSSTGNAALSFATYLAAAGIEFWEFAPSYVDAQTVDAFKATGQHLEIVGGNYGEAKKAASLFSDREHVLCSLGNTDPLRIESKKVLVFECLRQMGALPTVYVQAVAGGTSPLAFYKGCRDMGLGLPRMVLAQQDTCDPMVTAWEEAQSSGFPAGWERRYRARTDVNTRIGILTAANPGNYPLLAPLVRQSGGCFVRVRESDIVDEGRAMVAARKPLMGPASVVCFLGFREAVGRGLVHDGDTVLLNMGEGSARYDWFKEQILISDDSNMDNGGLFGNRGGRGFGICPPGSLSAPEWA